MKRFSEIRRPVTPERRARIDAIKEAIDDAIALSELRSMQNVTQVTLANRLGISQGNVSELERREDLYLSTLRNYVEALGGQLEVRAVFPEQQVVLGLAIRDKASRHAVAE